MLQDEDMCKLTMEQLESLGALAQYLSEDDIACLKNFANVSLGAFSGYTKGQVNQNCNCTMLSNRLQG